MKTIVITGSSSGIGKAAAVYFAEHGWNVAATMRNPQKETELNQLDHVRLFALDVTDSASIDNAYEEIKKEYGTIDVLFNNAGYCLFGPLELSTEKQIRDTYEVLLIGLTLMTKKFTPLLRENGGGTIINTSSVGGILTLPMTPTYHAAKYAVEGLTEALSYELAPFNIDVKVIEPGGIKTDFWNRSFVMTEGVEDSPYKKEAGRALGGFLTPRDPENDNRALPEDVAAVVYQAATDGSHHWRYMVACEDFVKWRRSMSDDEWYELQVKGYMGK